MLGGTRLTYLGHSTFRFTTAGSEQIIIDPFLTDNPQTPDELKQVGELDIYRFGTRSLGRRK
jgi:L-ascorbate metabolism protein UlaG (beta-lactamase superfamily)